MRLPDGFTQEVVRLSELDGNHDPAVHGLVQVIGTVCSKDNQTIMSAKNWGGGGEGGRG